MDAWTATEFCREGVSLYSILHTYLSRMSECIVKLRVGGESFEAEKKTLLRFKNTYFYGLLSSGAWHPEADGAYFIDRPCMGFDRILEYLRSGILSVEGLSQLEEECVYSNLDFFLIPYKRQWLYNTQTLIEGFRAIFVCELKDGRLCGVYKNDIVVWNADTCTIEMTMKGHTRHVYRVLQLDDGQVCSCSDDATVKLWNIDSRLCELTLIGHTIGVICMIELSDGRLCTCSFDMTIKIWNILTGACEMTLTIWICISSIVQLADGRICCGDYHGVISIYTLLTGECELSWEAHTHYVNAIVCIDTTRICSGCNFRIIKVWSVGTGECLRTLYGHTGPVISMILLQDGRLCSGSDDGTIKLWNLETGDWEKALSSNHRGSFHNVIQLSDGRLVSCADSYVYVWS